MLVVPTPSSESIRNPRPTRASLPSRQAASPLTVSSVVPSRCASLSSHSRAVAAWEADAIEPDVSSHSSFYASVQDSLSTDGESSDHSARRLLGFRGLGLRVSLPSRRRKTFQYHVPVHLLQAAPPAVSSRRQQLAAPTSGDMGFPTSPLHPTRCKQRATSSFVSATPNGASPWIDRAKPSVVDLSDHDESFDVPSSEMRTSSLSSSSSSSRRRRAWSSLKAHAKLPRMKRTTKGMFSISFYPWKMEAHGYYSTPEAAVAWVPDTASPRCQLCAAHFTLARRRHHCRLCGKLVCNECSLPRTFLPIAEDTLQREAHRSLIKSGEPQRTCDACAATLARMVAQHDHRVNAICVPPDSTSSSPQPRGGSPAVMRSSSDQQLAPRPRGVSRASVIRNDELDQVLRARAQSRAANAASERPRQHVISSLWLEQWLQFVQMDSSDTVSRVSTRTRPSRSSVTSRGSLSSRRRFSSRFAAGRRPGPISNYELLEFVNGTLVPREGLRRSRGTEGTGDYHVISHDVWQVFLRLYGGGPCITIDGDASPPPSSSHRMITTAVYGDVGACSPPPQQWTITELDPEDACRVPHTSSDLTCKERPSRVQPTPMPPTPQPLALRSTPAAYAVEAGKVSAKRPASATMISTPTQPPTFARSTTGEISSTNDPQRRRKSLPFMGYIKKWRQGDGGDPSQSRPSGASTTISQLDDDGVVLYDPAKLVKPTHAIEEGEGNVDFAGSRGSSDQRETIAAVSAFAAAAAEARRKSTMSLLRHHTTREPPQASTVTA